MTHFSTKFSDHAKKNSLTVDERTRMRARLMAEMANSVSVPSPYAPNLWFGPFTMSSRFAYAFAAVLLIIGISGSTAYAAEGAVPGDLLYNVKVNVNEPVALALATSPQAKADTHTAIAAERLSEGATLASEGALTASTSESLAASFAANASDAVAIADSIATIDPNVAAAVRANLSSAVETNATSLLAMGDQAGDGTRIASGNLARLAIASTISDTQNAEDAQIADTAGAADEAASSSELAIAEPVAPAMVTESAKMAVPVAENADGTQASTSSEVVAVSALSAPMMKAAVAPAAAPVSAALHVVPATVSRIRVPQLSDLSDAITAAQAQFDAASSTLSASSTDYVANALGNARLLAVKVQADTAAGDDASARADLLHGLASIARLRAFVSLGHRDGKE